MEKGNMDDERDNERDNWDEYDEYEEMRVHRRNKGGLVNAKKENI